MGLAGTATTQPYASPYVRRRSWSLFLQDNWRATSKLTLTYGIRWDYNGWPKELHDRQSEFSYNTPIPSLGNIGGGIIYEGYGTGRCNCSFVNAYPFNIGPRIGAAYQLDAKTVLRGGFGVTYGQPDRSVGSPTIPTASTALVITSSISRPPRTTEPARSSARG